jgi:hypothetical protein
LITPSGTAEAVFVGFRLRSKAKKSGDAREEESAAACYRKPREEEGLSDPLRDVRLYRAFHRRAARCLLAVLAARR